MDNFDTGTAIVILYWFFVSMLLIVFLTICVMILYYVVRGSRAGIHYAARRWWRW